MKQNKGFTLVELMAVIAIVSILSVIALAAYGDYVVRTKVSEGMVFAAEAKTSISEYYSNLRQLPSNNADAGLRSVIQYENSSYNYIHYIEITSTSTPAQKGIIAVKFKIIGSTADNKFLHLIPSTAGETLSWTCEPPAVDGIEEKYAPANCRG